MNTEQKTYRTLTYVFSILLFMFTGIEGGFTQPIPFPKKMNKVGGSLRLDAVSITAGSANVSNEEAILVELFKNRGIDIRSGGIAVRVDVGRVDVPSITSTYREEIALEGYRLEVDPGGISICGASPRAVFYAIQTLDQLIGINNEIFCVEIIDFPDLPVRMIMIDPARQNENMDYYRRLIRFAARYKMNAILCHLTDDQTACLYHEAYPELMHPHAWTTTEIKELVAYAAKYHVELIPEVESFGHSRMFTRRMDYKDFLHQTKGGLETSPGWLGTDVPGYTNVLCPASSKAKEYLDVMYERASVGFEHPWIHIGCDEVDISECALCEKAFGKISPSEWIKKHLVQCRDLVVKRGKKTALWGDMLLHYPEVVDEFPTTETIIFDWHYIPDVKEDSVLFFKKKGFEVVACPALVCSPHMIMPDTCNLRNIERFTRIAREHDIYGVNTTIWIPTRYMSDVLWTGIAYAAVHAWSGSQWDENSFYKGFMKDFFGSDQGESFRDAYTRLTSIIWHRNEFISSCWIDEESFNQARDLFLKKREEVEKYMMTLADIQRDLKNVRESITKNRIEWETLERSRAVLLYTMLHLSAPENAKTGTKWDIQLIKALDDECVRLIGWIEEDWDRNRYPDDPNKNGLYLTNQHLLYRFKQMHDFHTAILKSETR